MARKRFTFKNIPEPLSVPLSFRVPESAGLLLNDRVAKLKAAGELDNRSEALQDALVTWLMTEEYAERQAGTTLEEIVGQREG